MQQTKTGSFLAEAKLKQSDIVSLRRQIHQNPELSFQEKETAKLAAEKLSALGYEIKTGVGKTGVVANLGSGYTVAVRADMDGLPIQETTGTPYQSKNANVMHACGHDAHVSCVLTTAELLAKAKPDGCVRILMQPAEEYSDSEGKSGAMRMIEDGAMKGVSAVIGLHMDASLEAGKVSILTGPTMAAADVFKITIVGKGGHGAYPETTIDSVYLSSIIIQAIQQIVSRKVSALDPAVITVGSVKSSSVRGNVISDYVELLGTLRSFNKATRSKLMEELEKACSLARNFGGDYKLEWELGYPATINDASVAAIMRKAACDLIGAENVVEIPPKTWSEDFSLLAEAAPGAFMFLGGEIKGDRRQHHSPTFDIDESGLYLGSAILAETAARLLSTKEIK
ncbi:MAG: amidohydrolase [Candidatus Obscuribacterales bacterium]|nr:amidohydrolase [Candidatus Obscuribacterales bacterium]